MLKASKIKPFLWFDTEAEEAAKFYTSVFRNSKMGPVTRYPEGGPRPAGMVMTAEFELEGLSFVALNGGPEFKFTEAVSFAVGCEDQKEIDDYWEKLIAGGGKPVQCGWLKDRFGLSWQIVPKAWDTYYTDPKRAARVMQVMMKMVKLDLAALEAAAK
ncbi:MAG: VOC family protein [Betaproteobacteria bacterium]|nr:VOC family protein [Betaproteobacteria bacterium]MDH5577025.1 VOC family protein [Betaproteobacteria bacterium]